MASSDASKEVSPAVLFATGGKVEIMLYAAQSCVGLALAETLVDAQRQAIIRGFEQLIPINGIKWATGDAMQEVAGWRRSGQ